MTDEEFKSLYLGLRPLETREDDEEIEFEEFPEEIEENGVPNSVDWSNIVYVKD